MKYGAIASDDPLDIENVFSPYKLLAFPNIVSDALEGRELAPVNLEINPINFCNQSCTWCTYGYLHNRKESLPIEHILALLDDAADIGVKSVTWTGGGEPTAYKKLMVGLERASALGFSQGINTNGSNLPEPMQNLIADSFDYVRFSVDAGTSETYSKTHRVKLDAFDKVIANIERICERRTARKSGLVVGFSFLVDESNVSDLAQAARLAKSIGVDYFQIKPIVYYEECNSQFDEESTLWKDLYSQCDQVADLPDETFNIRLLGHKFEDMRRTDIEHGRSYSSCRGNELLATVGADGSVDLCCAFKGQEEWSFGNIQEKSFKEIWDSDQRRDVMAKVNVKKCPPLCKAHEINKLIHYMKNMKRHKNFI